MHTQVRCGPYAHYKGRLKQETGTHLQLELGAISKLVILSHIQPHPNAHSTVFQTFVSPHKQITLQRSLATHTHTTHMHTQVRCGPYARYKGRVKQETSTHLQLELDAINKIVMVKREHVLGGPMAAGRGGFMPGRGGMGGSAQGFNPGAAAAGPQRTPAHVMQVRGTAVLYGVVRVAVLGLWFCNAVRFSVTCWEDPWQGAGKASCVAGAVWAVQLKGSTLAQLLLGRRARRHMSCR
jgi:hypothetical protein